MKVSLASPLSLTVQTCLALCISAWLAMGASAETGLAKHELTHTVQQKAADTGETARPTAEPARRQTVPAAPPAPVTREVPAARRAPVVAPAPPAGTGEARLKNHSYFKSTTGNEADEVEIDALAEADPDSGSADAGPKAKSDIKVKGSKILQN